MTQIVRARPARRPPGATGAGALLRAAHGGPALAVTALTALLGLAAGLPPGRWALVVVAVLAGQLSIGWSNDLLDARRDRSVARTDKPLATGALRPRPVRRAAALAVLVTLAASAGLSVLGLAAAGLTQLVHVAAGWAYNLGLKATVWSFVPYAVAFGALPVCVALAADPPSPGPAWAAAAGALLGVGAHLLNALPDLADDAATGVRGLPHVLGQRWTPPAALGVLLAATAVLAVGAALGPLPGALLVVVAAVVAGAGLARGGRTAFRAAVAVALLDVAVWVVAR